ncbi:molybdopterin-dependent oxidoreductase [Actinomadura sp. DC4]|uniref:molybdopterin oxidoreductase family protein n=1 Tax=Actinomadura sp. DC4 TaxID=3055069 RepID=UPI0025AF03FB|nr:molybdopterin-dependent oxidoreductase [Actinomadura sp. DC4]MDN3351422.1 molybdopterin-dependent oxidoreductase [Actinomadura sp. DC4]
MRPTPTHCPYCALQCGTLVDAGTATPREDAPGDAGAAYGPAWTAGELLCASDRLTVPLMRLHRNAPLQAVSWEAALDRIAGEIRRIQRASGPDAVAVLGGGGLTNEKAYQLGKFARVALRTANVDYNGRSRASSAAVAQNRAFGLDRGLPVPVTDVAEADTILLVGGDVAETMPAFARQLAAQRERGGTLIVVDSRETATARQADLHLQLTPGTDLALANGLLHLAMTEGLTDEAYVRRRTSGFAAVRRSAGTYGPERVERITRVPADRLREAVRLLSLAPRALVLTARGEERHAAETDTVTAFINLALGLGLPGRAGSGFGCLTGRGGREYGQKADRLPGYRRIDDPAAREHVARVWGVDPADLPGAGLPATELLRALGTPGGPRALLLFGADPVVSAPDSARIEERLEALDFLAVADFVPSETALRADVVLPTTQWAEETGTVTNLEGRVLLRRAALPKPPTARGDLEIIAALAGRLDAPGRFSAEPAEVFDELRAASAGGVADYSGITYERIAAETGVFWPCPGEDHPGTPRVFLNRFPTADGRARAVPVEHRGPEEETCGDYPLHLTTGRALARHATEAYVELHPDLAGRLDVAEGSTVRVTGRAGGAVARVRLTETIRRDMVFMPYRWAGAALPDDPAPRVPEVTVGAVRIDKDE